MLHGLVSYLVFILVYFLRIRFIKIFVSIVHSGGMEEIA